MTKEAKSDAIKEEAQKLGFAACGFSEATFLEEDSDRLKHWLDSGYHASMHYMENYFQKRADPTLLVEGAKSVISLLMNYKTENRQESPSAPVVSKHAYGEDYHFVMKRRMKQLLQFMQENMGPVKGRTFVDTAPVLDRAWAWRGGLGWIGKNSNLINRKHGSFVFIGEIICDLELEYNEIPERDYCGTCARCIDSCPTNAILPGRTIDANKCISYQTIENREELPESLAGKFDHWVFGCDVCQDVCPWNRKSPLHTMNEFEPSSEICSMTADDWEELSEEEFCTLFKKSALKRTGFKGLKRNLEFLRKDANSK
ncbi:MAG TPA: tRNA epoxyqueuosine(34) reductase QueG [Bacteroidales bacterium]|nr:tRNA epoxyqueuosine(34) reductase QueG [Bacteroidales bacterium]